MAVIAVVAARDVRRMLASGCYAVMAGAASPDHLGVIDDKHRLPNVRGVAVFADVCCQCVRRTLTRCVRTVMAVHAVAGDSRVIECGGQPASGRVTVIAGVTARNMCRVFAGRYHSVMAGTAGTYDLGVVDTHHWRKYIGRMAVFADIRRLNVPAVLAGRLRAVMAADTVAGDIQMIEVRR